MKVINETKVLLNLESEKRINRLRSLLSNLLKSGFFHIFGSNTINQIVNFAHGILIVRVMSRSDYGIYGYALSIFQFFLLLSGFGMVSAIMQLASECADDAEKAKSLLQYSYRFGLKFNTILSVLILLTSLFIQLPIQGSNVLLGMMFLLPILLVFKDLQIVWLRVNLKNREFSAVNTTNAVIFSASTILGALAFRSVGIIISHYLVAAFMIILLWKHYHIPFIGPGQPLTGKDKKDLFQIAGVFTINDALSQVLGLVGLLFLGMYVQDMNTIASFKVATTIPLALNFIPSALVVYVYPHFARHKDDINWVKEKYSQMILFVIIGNLLITLGGVVLAEPIIRIMFGNTYIDSIHSFRILMWSYFFSGTFRTISGNLLVSQRVVKFNLVIGFIGALTSIVFNITLIPVYGAVGAAYAQLITSIVTGLIATSALIITITFRRNQKHG